MSLTIPNPTKDQGIDDRQGWLNQPWDPQAIQFVLPETYISRIEVQKNGKKTSGNLFFLWNHLQVCLDPPSTHKHICLLCFTSYVTYVFLYIYVYILLQFFGGEWSGRWFLICPCVGSVLDRQYPSIGEY